MEEKNFPDMFNSYVSPDFIGAKMDEFDAYTLDSKYEGKKDKPKEGVLRDAIRR